MRAKYYPIDSEPTGSVLYNIIDLAQEYCKSFILVVRRTVDLAPSGLMTLDKLERFLLLKENKSSWPGTDLMDGDEATIYSYSLNNESAAILKSVNDRLYSWVQPRYPEDLCFIKGNENPWFITITHEHEAFFIVNEDEKHKIEANLPTLRLSEPFEK